MARSSIPPAPSRPKRARPLELEGERSCLLGEAGDVHLEARFGPGRVGSGRGLLLCHAHPLYGGSMDAPGVASVAAECARRGVSYLRFNFRGVGQSEGEYGYGDGELRDVLLALANLRRLGAREVVLYGHSFGGWLALRAAAEDRAVHGVALAGPPVGYFPFGRGEPAYAGPVTIVVGDSDALCSVEEARALGAQLEARATLVLAGADHDFRTGSEALAVDVVDFAVAHLPA